MRKYKINLPLVFALCLVVVILVLIITTFRNTISSFAPDRQQNFTIATSPETGKEKAVVNAKVSLSGEQVSGNEQRGLYTYSQSNYSKIALIGTPILILFYDEMDTQSKVELKILNDLYNDTSFKTNISSILIKYNTAPSYEENLVASNLGVLRPHTKILFKNSKIDSFIETSYTKEDFIKLLSD
jgi:hypothetical protein